jgi:hypothetical protein
MPGKPPRRLSEHYHLSCDYGTAMVLSWEKGGVAPIYLCEVHAAELGFLAEDSSSEPLSRPALDAEPVEHPANSVFATPSRHSQNASEDLQNASGKDLRDALEKERLTLASAPPASLMPSYPAGVLADESTQSGEREDFEAHGTVLRRSSTAVEEQEQHSEAERLCVSAYGERCTYESTVHCPKCRKWFCDTHAEDGNWHCCVRRM